MVFSSAREGVKGGEVKKRGSEGRAGERWIDRLIEREYVSRERKKYPEKR